MIESFGAAIAAAAVKVVRDLVQPIGQRLEKLVQRHQSQGSRLLHPRLQTLTTFRRIADLRVVEQATQRFALVRQFTQLGKALLQRL